MKSDHKQKEDEIRKAFREGYEVNIDKIGLISAILDFLDNRYEPRKEDC